jgi:hypothetical protein
MTSIPEITVWGGKGGVNIDELRSLYLVLPDSDKRIFLAFVSYQLTIHGRCFALDLKGVEQINAFKGLNELQH